MHHLHFVSQPIQNDSSRLNDILTSNQLNANQRNNSNDELGNLANTIRNHRLESLSPMELLIFINQVRSISIANHHRRRTSLSEFSDEEEVNSQSSSEEYIDFRTYPIPIDWEKIENDKGDYFSVQEKFGYFGVGIYSSLLEICKIKIDTDEFIASFLKHYYTVYRDKTKLDDLLSFMDSLPTLSSIKTLLSSGAILTKEKSLMKIVLDMYERFYLKYDKPCFSKLNNEYLILAEEFYSYCSESEIKEIWNSLFNVSSNIKDKIKIMKFKISPTKEGYIKHFNRIKKKCAMLTKGTSLSKFIQ